MLPEDIERLRHMQDAAREAISFLEGRNRIDLDNDRQLAMALVKEVEIIGEAENRITNATRREGDEIPWLDIIGMRHRLVHAYFDINTTILWKTVKDDLPAGQPHFNKTVTAATKCKSMRGKVFPPHPPNRKECEYILNSPLHWYDKRIGVQGNHFPAGVVRGSAPDPPEAALGISNLSRYTGL